jgi:hypothetical protein
MVTRIPAAITTTTTTTTMVAYHRRAIPISALRPNVLPGGQEGTEINRRLRLVTLLIVVVVVVVVTTKAVVTHGNPPIRPRWGPFQNLPLHFPI